MTARAEWNVRSRQEVFDGRPWLRVWAETLELPNGRMIDGFYSLDLPDYAVVFAAAEGGAVVQRGYKHGPRSVGLHLPAGYVEDGEEPLETAKRELLEETGYEADAWTALGSFSNDGNRGAGRGHLFRADRARRVADPSSTDLEDVATLLMPPDELVAALRRGEVPVLSSAAAIALATVTATS